MVGMFWWEHPDQKKYIVSKVKDLIFTLRNSKLTFPPHESLWSVYWWFVLLFYKKYKTYDTTSRPYDLYFSRAGARRFCSSDFFIRSYLLYGAVGIYVHVVVRGLRK